MPTRDQPLTLLHSVLTPSFKPKFEVHIKIYELNNLPLGSGTVYVKWRLLHSMYAEHHGRTLKSAIANNRAEFSYGHVLSPVRIAVDRSGNLGECVTEFEAVQEFPPSLPNGNGAASGASSSGDKTVVGVVRLNLSEFVDESEALVRDGIGAAGRKRANGAVVSTSPTLADHELRAVKDGICSRYLLRESKINGTLQIGILIIQIDGDRNFVTPPRTKENVFGVIAGITVGEPVEKDQAGRLPKSVIPTEDQDLYRTALIASWNRLPSQLPVDACIEDIFAGGDGWGSSSTFIAHKSQSRAGQEDNSLFHPEDGPYFEAEDTIRPLRTRHHSPLSPLNSLSPTSVTSASTYASGSTIASMGSQLHPHSHSHSHAFHLPHPHHNLHIPHGLHARHHSPSRDRTGLSPHPGTDAHRLPASFKPGLLISSNEEDGAEGHGLRDSVTSLALTNGSGSDHVRDLGFRRTREVCEEDLRQDHIAWKLPYASP